jgi:FKBP-type peptidyl-prolyl cis-trans isomerase
MKVGGKRRVIVPPELGFGSQSDVLAPYAVLPAGSTLQYEVQLLRVSSKGPDALWKVSRQGQVIAR